MEKMLCRDRFYRPIIIEKVEDFYSIKLVDDGIELLAFEVDKANLIKMVKVILEVLEEEIKGD